MRVAECCAGGYELVLTDTTREGAENFADSLREGDAGFDVAVVTYPDDGRSGDALLQRLGRVRDQPDSWPIGGGLPGNQTERLDQTVARLSRADISVLILGETGVGKEVLARRIHDLSARAGEVLVAINCAALTDSLVESELFGHEKGAFTGAATGKVGLLESAGGGTVFLDEIGDMPPGLQAKLLRVLEQREVTRVGALRPRPIDARFIAATNQDLESAIGGGRFRADLYYRLAGLTLVVPPLRDRVEEIEPLALMFADRAARSAGRSGEIRLAPGALRMLRAHDWPGNVRELKNAIERAVVLSSGNVITEAHVRIAASHGRVRIGVAAQTRQGRVAIVSVDPERQRVSEALDRSGGNQREAAKQLGIARGTLIRRMDQFGLARPRKR